MVNIRGFAPLPLSEFRGRSETQTNQGKTPRFRLRRGGGMIDCSEGIGDGAKWLFCRMKNRVKS